MLHRTLLRFVGSHSFSGMAGKRVANTIHKYAKRHIDDALPPYVHVDFYKDPFMKAPWRADITLVDNGKYIAGTSVRRPDDDMFFGFVPLPVPMLLCKWIKTEVVPAAVEMAKRYEEKKAASEAFWGPLKKPFQNLWRKKGE